MLFLAQGGNERLPRELSLVCKGKTQRHLGHREQKEASGGKGEGRSEAALGLMGHRHTPHPRLRERCAPCPSCSPCFSVPSVLLTLSFCAGQQDLALPLASFWLRLCRAVSLWFICF